MGVVSQPTVEFHERRLGCTQINQQPHFTPLLLLPLLLRLLLPRLLRSCNAGTAAARLVFELGLCGGGAQGPSDHHLGGELPVSNPSGPSVSFEPARQGGSCSKATVNISSSSKTSKRSSRSNRSRRATFEQQLSLSTSSEGRGLLAAPKQSRKGSVKLGRPQELHCKRFHAFAPRTPSPPPESAAGAAAAGTIAPSSCCYKTIGNRRSSDHKAAAGSSKEQLAVAWQQLE
ncbi:hypothetical protein ACSSS7_004885 [Eimeria intestinalis]